METIMETLMIVVKFMGAIIGIIIFGVLILMVVISGGVKEMFDEITRKRTKNGKD